MPVLPTELLSSLEIANPRALRAQTLWGSTASVATGEGPQGNRGGQDRRRSRKMARHGTWEAQSCLRAGVVMGCPTTRASALLAGLRHGGELLRRRTDRQHSVPAGGPIGRREAGLLRVI